MTWTPISEIPSPLHAAADAYAHGRLDSTRKGDKWVHIKAFTDRARAQQCGDTLSLQRLYNSMLKAGGEFVFGGDTVPEGDPELTVVPGGAS